MNVRFAVKVEIYLSPSMMDVLYERSVIIRERQVPVEVVEEQLRKYIGAFAEVESISVQPSDKTKPKRVEPVGSERKTRDEIVIRIEHGGADVKIY